MKIQPPLKQNEGFSEPENFKLRAKRESSIVIEKVYTLFGPIFQLV